MCEAEYNCRDLEESNKERVTKLLLDIIDDQKNRIISQQQTIQIKEMNKEGRRFN